MVDQIHKNLFKEMLQVAALRKENDRIYSLPLETTIKMAVYCLVRKLCNC